MKRFHRWYLLRLSISYLSKRQPHKTVKHTQASFICPTSTKTQYLTFPANENKNNGINIIAKSNEEAWYPYVSIGRHRDYRKQKIRALLVLNQGSTPYLQEMH